MASLAILWRNPKPVKHQTRYRRIKNPSDHRKIFVVEELLSPKTGAWVSIAMFELVPSGARSASGATKERKWHFRFGSSRGA